MKRILYKLIFTIVTIAATSAIVAAQEHVSNPEFLYSQDSVGIQNADASSATIRGVNGELMTFLSTYRCTYRISGTIHSPWGGTVEGILHDEDPAQPGAPTHFFYDLTSAAQLRTAEYVIDGNTTNYEAVIDGHYNISIYLMNVMKTNVDQELIGLFHTEYLQDATYDATTGNKLLGDNTYDANYAISVGYSIDNGRHWNFCGDIIQTNDQIKNGSRNIGGAASILVRDSIYVYLSLIHI